MSRGHASWFNNPFFQELVYFMRPACEDPRKVPCTRFHLLKVSVPQHYHTGDQASAHEPSEDALKPYPPCSPGEQRPCPSCVQSVNVTWHIVGTLEAVGWDDAGPSSPGGEWLQHTWQCSQCVPSWKPKCQGSLCLCCYVNRTTVPMASLDTSSPLGSRKEVFKT